jgi:2-methylcitrate dehydratase
MKSARRRPIADDAGARVLGIGRRDFIKMGAGAGAGIAVSPLIQSSGAIAQHSSVLPISDSTQPQAGWLNNGKTTGPGWKNTANRSAGNGPIDKTTHEIVAYVSSFSEAQLTSSVVDAVCFTMLDSMAALIAGFESEPARICARLARTTRSDLKSTVLGYGITTTPDIAAFANGCMLRHTDFNDIPHNSDILSGILAIAEAVHATGPETMVAIALGYELASGIVTGGSGLGAWDGIANGPAVAMAMGKLLKMNEDQLANALSLSLVPHIPLKVTHVGALSMWKGCHSAESVRCAVFDTLLAREGMTGPSQPFEAREGLYEHMGRPTREERLPVLGPSGKMAIERAGYKRYPSEGSTQSVLELIPAIRKSTRAEDIASIYVELPYDGWLETADPPKWDPRNHETADHSMPYVIARALIDGEIYLDSFTQEKIMDPVARQLMDKISAGPNSDYTYQGEARLTVVTQSGQKIIEETLVHMATAMTHEEVIHKFNRVCAFRSISDQQRDRARELWLGLPKVHDIAEPMNALASFGHPLPL